MRSSGRFDVMRVSCVALALVLGGCWSSNQRLLANDADLDSFPASYGLYRSYSSTTSTCAVRLDSGCYEESDHVAIESLIFVKTVVVASRGSNGAISQQFLSMRRLSGADFVVEQMTISGTTRVAVYGVANVADGRIRVWLPSCRTSTGPAQVIATRAGAYFDQSNNQCTFYSLSSLVNAASQYRDFVQRVSDPPDKVYVFERSGSRSSL